MNTLMYRVYCIKHRSNHYLGKVIMDPNNLAIKTGMVTFIDGNRGGAYPIIIVRSGATKR